MLLVPPPVGVDSFSPPPFAVDLGSSGTGADVATSGLSGLHADDSFVPVTGSSAGGPDVPVTGLADPVADCPGVPVTGLAGLPDAP